MQPERGAGTAVGTGCCLEETMRRPSLNFRRGLPIKVCETMTRDVEIVSPEDSIRTAARMLADSSIGALPVGENDRLVGMVTDRDIVIRAVAEGAVPDSCEVRQVMTADVECIFDDEDC